MAKSKRRSKNSAPNIPQETLDRARRQLQGDDEASDSSEEMTTSEVVEKVAAEKKVTKPIANEIQSTRTKRTSDNRSTRRRSTSSANGVQFGQREKRKKDVLDHEKIEEMLAHPTIFVTEEQLHEEYGYVLTDLRKMGLLAVGLMVLLVAMAQFI